MKQVEQLYIKKCKELGVRHKLRKFRKVHDLARAYIGESVSTVTDSMCPIFIQEISGGLYYFIKVVDDTAYPAILTKYELTLLGYSSAQLVTGGSNEPLDEIEIGNDKLASPKEGAGEHGISD